MFLIRKIERRWQEDTAVLQKRHVGKVENIWVVDANRKYGALAENGDTRIRLTHPKQNAPVSNL